MEYNIYCDESCHLEFDRSNVMVLGAISCPSVAKASIFNDIRNIKKEHGLSSFLEIKWTKVSPAKIDFYLDIVRYFFSQEALSYRAVIATNKDKLDNDYFNDGSYDLWYYKMYYLLLENLIDEINSYKIFLDIKDTNGGAKVKELHNILCNSKHDAWHDIIKDIRQINSRESEILQIVDLLNGALAYFNRGLYSDQRNQHNLGKVSIIDELLIKQKIRLSNKTSKYEPKFNILVWTPREARK